MGQLTTVVLAISVGTLFVVLGGYFVVDKHTTMANAEQTEAVVLDTYVVRFPGDETPTTYAPVVEYRYEVDNETYTSDQVYPGPGRKSTQLRSDAEAVLESYPVNETVTAYVTAGNPEQSFLIKTGPSLAPFLFIGVGLLIDYLVVRKVLRY